MLEIIEKVETNIPCLGPAKIDSPLLTRRSDVFRHFIEEGERVLVNITQPHINEQIKNKSSLLSFELAGPRRKIYFDPTKLKCGIVTCGGLCPGINDVIRALVMELYHVYGVKTIYGFKYGLEGFIPKYGHELIELIPARVASIHELGGTVLGTSRGPQNIEEIVDTLDRLNIGILFMIGGDGTLRAAAKISDEVMRRGLKCSVIAIPKTIDNDIYLVEKSFGFDTAVEKATEAIRAAHTEAIAAYNGIGLVKLMGRFSGFIAAYATLGLREVNFTLIPEVDFDLEGKQGLLEGWAKEDARYITSLATETSLRSSRRCFSLILSSFDKVNIISEFIGFLAFDFSCRIFDRTSKNKSNSSVFLSLVSDSGHSVK